MSSQPPKDNPAPAGPLKDPLNPPNQNPVPCDNPTDEEPV